jgi:hypothetical protein
MRFLQATIAVLTASLAASQTTAQDPPSTLPPAQQLEIAQRAYSLYYNPLAKGLQSIDCDIKLDWSTLPPSILVPAENVGKDSLHATKLHLTADATGAQNITVAYPVDASAQARSAYDKFFDWASRAVGGFFMTWKAKAMQSPIPPGKYISNVASTPDGYQISAKYGDGTVTFSLSKDLVVARLLSTNGAQSIEEQTTYTQTPQGLILTAVDTTNTAAQGTTHILYDLTYQSVNSILFPDKIHLTLEKLVNMRFSFENCTVKKNEVINVSPPPGN